MVSTMCRRRADDKFILDGTKSTRKACCSTNFVKIENFEKWWGQARPDKTLTNHDLLTIEQHIWYVEDGYMCGAPFRMGVSPDGEARKGQFWLSVIALVNQSIR